MRFIPTLDATAPGVVVGRHSIWLTALGVKVPFQWGANVTKYGHREPVYAIGATLPHEIAILRALAAEQMAPPVGEVVYFGEVVSHHPGGWHCDPCGAYGYEMADATKLPPGRFSIEAMRRLPIEGSEGAWGDIAKEGNVVNGYLVDVRRSAWDMLRWTGPGLDVLPAPPIDDTIAADVHRLCQFPQGARETAYQDFYLDGAWQRGERRIVERARAMGFTPRPGETVLEIGCQAGGMLQFADLMMAQTGTALGVELDADYIACGRRLARRARQNLCVRRMNAVEEADALVEWVKQRAPQGLDHLLVLSMEKHLGHAPLFDLVDRIGARRTYIETNAVSEKNPWKLREEVVARGGSHVGDTTDRNLRRLYRIEKTP